MEASEEQAYAEACVAALEHKRTITPAGSARWACMKCGGFGDDYMVTDEVWAATGLAPHAPGILCLKDLEATLGRKLSVMDFTMCIANAPIFRGFLMGKQS